MLEPGGLGATAHITIEEVDVFNIWKNEKCAVNELKNVAKTPYAWKYRQLSRFVQSETTIRRLFKSSH